MNKAAKATIILAVIILIVGLGLGIWGLYKNNWRFDNLMIELEEKTYENESEFNKISVDVYNSSISIEYGEAFKVTYTDNTRMPISFAVENSELRITSGKSWFGNWFGNNSMKMDITVPYHLTLIDVKTSNGSLSLKNLDVNGNISMNSSNGNFNAAAVKAQSIDVDTSNGSLTLTNVEFMNSTMETSNGQISLLNVDGDTYTAKTSNGTVEMDDVSIKGISVKTSNGRMELKKVFSDKAYFKTSNGTITADVAARELETISSNGNVSVNLYGDEQKYNVSITDIKQKYYSVGNTTDYKVTLQSNSGKCSLKFLDAASLNQ